MVTDNPNYKSTLLIAYLGDLGKLGSSVIVVGYKLQVP